MVDIFSRFLRYEFTTHEPNKLRLTYLRKVIYLYYKRGNPYLCSAKAPVLEGSGSGRLYPLKGTSFDRVYVVFGACVDLGFFTIRQKRIRGGGAFSEGNSASLKQRRSSYEYPYCVSATRRLVLDNMPAQFNSPNTYTHTTATAKATTTTTVRMYCLTDG